MTRVVDPGGSIFATTWTDDGNRIAKAYKRVLRRLGSINEPSPAAYYACAFEANGFLTDSHDQFGSLMRWSGSRRD